MWECTDGIRAFNYEAFVWWMILWFLMGSMTHAIWVKVKKPLSSLFLPNLIMTYIVWIPLLLYVMGEGLGNGIVGLLYDTKGEDNEQEVHHFSRK